MKTSFQVPASPPQWYLDPESMRLPPPTIPEGAAPAARQILETLAVRDAHGARPRSFDARPLRTCRVALADGHAGSDCGHPRLDI